MAVDVTVWISMACNEELLKSASWQCMASAVEKCTVVREGSTFLFVFLLPIYLAKES